MIENLLDTCNMAQYTEDMLIRMLSLLFLFLFLFTPQASAQVPRHYYDWSSTLKTMKQQVLAATDSTQNTLPSFNKYLFGKDLLPSSRLYFAKRWQENIQVFLANNPRSRAEFQIAIASTRLEEIKSLVKSEDQSFIPPTVTSYEDAMIGAMDTVLALEKDGENTNLLLARIENVPAAQNITLHEINFASTGDTRRALEQAININESSSDLIADVKGEPAIPSDLTERIQSLQAQGILSADEAKKITNVKTRTTARQQLETYAADGIFPDADVLRLNDHVKSLYPDDFYKLYETKRFVELSERETEKPNQAILDQLQTFAATYKAGDPIPQDLKKYWISVIRLDELQNTLRPDLIDPQLLVNDKEVYQKLQEVSERFKPNPEDVLKLSEYLKKNNITPDLLPPDYLRLYNLAQKYGAYCGPNEQWVKTAGIDGKCMPGAANEAQKSLINLPVCPAKTHFVPVSFAQGGGYCVVDYAPITTPTKSSASQQSESCPVGYFRDVATSKCVQSYRRDYTEILLPTTQTPGTYPNPLYPPTSSSTTSDSSSTSNYTAPVYTSTQPTATKAPTQPTVTPATSNKPDVRVAGIQRADFGNVPAIGESVSFQSVISNSNINSATPPDGMKVKLRMLYDDSEVSTSEVTLSSTPNWTTRVNSNSISITSGRHKFRSCIDADNQLSESREDNNCLEWAFDALTTAPTPRPCPGNSAPTLDQACANIGCTLDSYHLCSNRSVDGSPGCVEATGCTEIPLTPP